MTRDAAYSAAEAAFAEYFARNYPGPDTVIFDPKWHAPKLFAAAVRAVAESAAPSLGASFEGVAESYAQDQKAAAKGIYAAFLAGAQFGCLRAANEFFAAQRGSPTPPVIETQILDAVRPFLGLPITRSLCDDMVQALCRIGNVSPSPTPSSNVEGDTAQISARLNRLLTTCHKLKWINVGVLATHHPDTKAALDELSLILFHDGLAEALATTEGRNND